MVAELVDLAGKARIGPALDPDTELGPIGDEIQLERVLGYVDRGVEDADQSSCWNSPRTANTSTRTPCAAPWWATPRAARARSSPPGIERRFAVSCPGSPERVCGAGANALKRTSNPELILIEWNELSPELLREFMARGELPNFERFYQSSQIFRTDAVALGPATAGCGWWHP